MERAFGGETRLPDNQQRQAQASKMHSSAVAELAPDFTSAGVILALPEEGQPMGGHTHESHCTICEMFLPPTHVEDHLIGKKHRRNVTRDQRHIGTASRPASSSEPAVQAGQGPGVRVPLLNLAGEEVGAINVAPDSGWREIAVEVQLHFPDIRAIPPADARAATSASMAAEGVQVIRRL